MAAGILGTAAPVEPSSSVGRRLGRAAGPPVQASPGRVPGPPPVEGQEGQAAPAQPKADVVQSGSLASRLGRRPPANGHSSRSQGWGFASRATPAGKSDPEARSRGTALRPGAGTAAPTPSLSSMRPATVVVRTVAATWSAVNAPAARPPGQTPPAVRSAEAPWEPYAGRANVTCARRTPATTPVRLSSTAIASR